MTDQLDCDICVLTYPSREVLECYGCDLAACGSCIEAYRRMPTTTSLSCMNTSCNIAWDMATLRTLPVNRSLIDTLYEIRLDSLVRLEEEYMRDTYREFMEEKSLEDVKNARLTVHEYAIEVSRDDRSLEDPQIAKVRELLREAEEHSKRWASLGGKNVDPIVRRCPFVGCNGFVTRSRNQCHTCYGFTCRTCDMPIEGDNHVCNPVDMATYREVLRTTKECPNRECGARIQLRDGCNQMWCTSCNTAFNYATGEEIDVNMSGYHNIHHQEYLNMRRDMALTMNNFGCFVGPNGDLTREDIQFAPDDERLISLMRAIINIDESLRSHWGDRAPSYNSETLREVRRRLIREGRSITDPEVLEDVRYEIYQEDKLIEARQEFYHLYFFFSRIMKDIIIARINYHRVVAEWTEEKREKERAEMENKFLLSILNGVLLYVRLIAYAQIRYAHVDKEAARIKDLEMKILAISDI